MSSTRSIADKIGCGLQITLEKSYSTQVNEGGQNPQPATVLVLFKCVYIMYICVIDIILHVNRSHGSKTQPRGQPKHHGLSSHPVFAVFPPLLAAPDTLSLRFAFFPVHLELGKRKAFR